MPVNSAFWVIFHAFLLFADFFFKIIFFESAFWVSNSLDPDQAWRFVRPDLDSNCLQRFSADDSAKLLTKQLKYVVGT